MFHADRFVGDAQYRRDALLSCAADRPLVLQATARALSVAAAAAASSRSHHASAALLRIDQHARHTTTSRDVVVALSSRLRRSPSSRINTTHDTHTTACLTRRRPAPGTWYVFHNLAQIAANEPELFGRAAALAAAAGGVDAIDLNLGCPQVCFVRGARERPRER